MLRRTVTGLILTAALLGGCEDKSTPVGSTPNEILPTGPKSNVGKMRQNVKDVVAKGQDGMGGQSREAVLMRAESKISEAESEVNSLISQGSGDALTKAKAAAAKIQNAKTRLAAAQSANADNTKVLKDLETSIAEAEAALAEARKAAG